MGRRIRAVIVHGAYGSPSENWFPWLAQQLEARGVQTSVPTFPTPERQTLDVWTGTFAERARELDDSTILVGHSLGVGFILCVLESLPRPVLGTFLVSAFVGLLGLSEFDSINATFVERDFDWARIRRNAGEVHVYNGDNDPYVPLERGYAVADNLGAQLEVITGGGHVNATAGFTTFPKLLADIERLASKTDA